MTDGAPRIHIKRLDWRASNIPIYDFVSAKKKGYEQAGGQSLTHINDVVEKKLMCNHGAERMYVRQAVNEFNMSITTGILLGRLNIICAIKLFISSGLIVIISEGTWANSITCACRRDYSLGIDQVERAVRSMYLSARPAFWPSATLTDPLQIKLPLQNWRNDSKYIFTDEWIQT